MLKLILKRPSKKLLASCSLALSFLILVACGGGGSSSSTTAEGVTTIRFAMSSEQEVPPVNSDASGSGTLSVSQETGAISGTINATGIEIAMAHIHAGAAGTNGPIVLMLDINGGTVTVPAGASLNPEQVNAFLNGQLYVNLHSAAFPAGELRGQIVP